LRPLAARQVDFRIRQRLINKRHRILVWFRAFRNIRHARHAVRRRHRNIGRRRQHRAGLISGETRCPGVAVARLDVFETRVFGIPRCGANFLNAVEALFTGIVTQYGEIIKNLRLVGRGAAFLIWSRFFGS